MLLRSLSPTQTGRCGPARQSMRSSMGSPRRRATARDSVSAHTGIVFESESGNRFVLDLVASTTTHPPLVAAASATCRLSRVALKLQLLQWPSVLLK